MQVWDKQRGEFWELSRPRWLASWRKFRLDTAIDLIPDGVGNSIIDAVIVLPMWVVAAVLFVLSVVEFLIHLLITPIRYLVQPSVRRAGWKFDLINQETEGPKKVHVTRTTTTSLWTPTRRSALKLRKELRQHLRAGASLSDPAVGQSLVAARATVTGQNVKESALRSRPA